jgi:hypothetical protein
MIALVDFDQSLAYCPLREFNLIALSVGRRNRVRQADPQKDWGLQAD